MEHETTKNKVEQKNKKEMDGFVGYINKKTNNSERNFSGSLPKNSGSLPALAAELPEIQPLLSKP